MYKFQFFFWVGLFFTVFAACTKEPSTLDTSPNLVWRSSLDSEGYVGSMSPIIYEDVVVFSRNSITNIQETPIAYNRFTGEKLWEWTDFINDSDQFWTGEHYSDGDLLILCAGPRIYCIDVKKGSTIWNSWDFKSLGNKDVTGIGSTIFHAKYSGTFPNLSTIRYRDIYSGDWQTILEVAWGEGFNSHVGGITP